MADSKVGAFVARNMKTVTNGVYSLLGVGTALAALIALVPQSSQVAVAATGGVLAAVEVVRLFHVWLVKNGPAIEELVDDVGELVEDVVDAVRGTGDGKVAGA